MADGDRLVILYDGVCVLCSRIAQFVLPRDRKDRFRFAALQGDRAREILARHQRSTTDLDTFYVVVDAGLPSERLLDRADAALRVLTELGGAWSLVRVFSILPRALLDALYDLVARRRYRWFGKTEACMLPRPEWRHKYLE